ncbi:MAG TPA: MBL fold metallo-hydrolase, partial [Firmicutes bacterium]|nr:MBL fold metallo-hydrolase [Candidatus Fermentithermobacillaceae bacterium]
THEHGDHAKAVKDLLKAGVDVYLSEGTAKTLAIEHHRLHTVKARAWFSVGDWLVMAFPVVHDAEEPFGFLVCREDARLLYLTDTAYSPFRFKNLTHIMVECNYDPEILRKNVEAGRVDKAVQRRVIRSHMSLPRLKDFLKATDLSNVREIVLVHLSDDNSDAEEFKRAVQRLTAKPVRIA